MKIIYILAVLFALQGATYFLFVRHENAQWSKRLLKFFGAVVALTAAYFWVRMAFDSDPISNVLTRIAGGFAGLFFIYYIYHKGTDAPEDRGRQAAHDLIYGNKK